MAIRLLFFFLLLVHGFVDFYFCGSYVDENPTNLHCKLYEIWEKMVVAKVFFFFFKNQDGKNLILHISFIIV